MKLTKYLFALSAIALVSTASADTNTEKQKVFDTVKAYADLTSCQHSFNGKGKDRTTLNEVYLVSNDNPENNIEYSKEYFVFWKGNKGCSFGSGADSSFVTQVVKSKSENKFIIVDDEAFGNGLPEKEFPTEERNQDNTRIKDELKYRFFEKIIQISPKKFKIIGWDYDYADEKSDSKDGGQNYPSNKFEYTIELQPNGDWIVTNKKLLGQKKYK